jgi:hypothetical protein
MHEDPMSTVRRSGGGTRFRHIVAAGLAAGLLLAIASSPGKHDGLYWPTEAGEPESPLGPFMANVRAEGYRAGVPHEDMRRTTATTIAC